MEGEGGRRRGREEREGGCKERDVTCLSAYGVTNVTYVALCQPVTCLSAYMLTHKHAVYADIASEYQCLRQGGGAER